MVRIKHRYLLLNVIYPDGNVFQSTSESPDYLKFHAPTPRHVTPQSLLAHLRTHITASFGDQGLGLCLSSLKLVYFSNATSTAILRVPRSHYQIVWATLTYMTELPAPKGRNLAGTKCVVRVVRVSGTIRKAEEELLRRSRRQVVQAKLSGIDIQDVVLRGLTGGDNSIYSSPTKNEDPALATDDSAGISESE